MPILVILAMLVSLFSMAVPVAADFDPADSNANSINLDLIRPNLVYNIGDTIYFSVIVETPAAKPVSNFYPGKNTEIVTTFTRPDGVVINFDVIPVQNRGEYVVFDYTTYPGLAYVVDAADVDPLVVGVVRAYAEVDGVSHCSVTGPLPGGNEPSHNDRQISTQVTIEPCIEILKTVDCNDDGTYLAEDTGSYGDTPSWKIEVHNCGDSPLHDVYVSDDYGIGWGPFNLDIDETWTVTYDHPEPIYEDTTNEAMAEGLDVFDGAVGPVYSSATNVVEIEPCIEILKTVDCNDDGTYLAEDTGSYGDTPSWYIKVWNCGDSPLLDVEVWDTNGMSWGPFDLVNPGDFWEVYYDGDPIFETTTNTAEASATDVLGGAVGPVYDSATNVVTGGEGCTPGYWKENAIKWGAVSWGPTGYSPSQTLESVFDVPDSLGLDNRTLLQALGFKGGKGVMGGAQILLRSAVAALLNAAHPEIDYYMEDVGALIAAVNAALATGDRATMLALYEELDMHNNDGCTLDMHGNPIIPVP